MKKLLAAFLLLAFATASFAANNAQFVSQSVPATMAPGQTYAVSVTMQNTGDTTWTSGSQYNLGSQNGQDNTTWGFARVALPNSVDPGSSVTFSFNVTAPATVGTYNFQWRMVQDGVEWFGAYSSNVAVKDGVNAAQFVSQTVPATMAPGQTYPVSVTMQNTGNTTWAAGSLYRLGSQNAQDNTTWGVLRVELPNSVAPGASVTFNFNLVAPSIVGTYNSQWRMVQDNVEWFGDYTPNVSVKDGVNAAQFVSQTVPATMTPGQTYAVSVTMQNTGNTTWTAGSLYNLGSQNPQDNSTWGLNRVPLPNAVAPGASVTFNFNMVAPSTVGTYNSQWRMVQDNVEWFGDYTPNIAVKAGVNAAQFVSQTVPSEMAPGQTYAVSVTMQNTGNTTWTAGAQYRLGSQNGQDNTTWGTARVELPGSVAPGASVTFNFNVTAPSTPNTYNFQWRMVQDNVEWFGDYTTNVAVKDGVNAAQFISQSVPSTFTPGQTKTVSLTFKNTGTTTWTDATQFHLGSQNAQDNSTWGLQRVSLPGPVAPGANVTFSFNVTAPVALGTYNFQWRMVQDTVEWFGDFSANVAVSVAGAAAAKVYYIHPDHLNTPRLVADDAQKTVWKWEQAEPFGNSAPQEDPDQDSTAFTMNLRLPGQFWDKETGLSYNYYRNYDSGTGRYLESDPIGLRGGGNTYVYVSGRPLMLRDIFGLCPISGVLSQKCRNALQIAGADAGALVRAREHWDAISTAADNQKVDPNLLAAIGIRESGFRNIPEIGGGNGRGVFQIDIGRNPAISESQAFNIPFAADFAGNMLSKNMSALGKKFPAFSATQLLQATAASYNFGLRNVSGNPQTIDVGTTGGNYGANVLDLLLFCFE